MAPSEYAYDTRVPVILPHSSDDYPEIRKTGERDAWTKARVVRLRLEVKIEPIPLPEREEGSES